MTRAVFLTAHAKQRLRERHDKHLFRYENEQQFNNSCYQLFNTAEDSRRFLNDTAFMLQMYEKYGYQAKFSFRVYKNAVFVIVGDACVTVLDSTVHAYTPQLARPHQQYKRQAA